MHVCLYNKLLPKAMQSDVADGFKLICILLYIYSVRTEQDCNALT